MVKIVYTTGGDLLSNKILELRIKYGLTKSEIVRELSISQHDYVMFELGMKEIPKELAEKVNNFLKSKGA